MWVRYQLLLMALAARCLFRVDMVRASIARAKQISIDRLHNLRIQAIFSTPLHFMLFSTLMDVQTCMHAKTHAQKRRTHHSNTKRLAKKEHDEKSKLDGGESCLNAASISLGQWLWLCIARWTSSPCKLIFLLPTLSLIAPRLFNIYFNARPLSVWQAVSVCCSHTHRHTYKEQPSAITYKELVQCPSERNKSTASTLRTLLNLYYSRVAWEIWPPFSLSFSLTLVNILCMHRMCATSRTASTTIHPCTQHSYIVFYAYVHYILSYKQKFSMCSIRLSEQL